MRAVFTVFVLVVATSGVHVGISADDKLPEYEEAGSEVLLILVETGSSYDGGSYGGSYTNPPVDNPTPSPPTPAPPTFAPTPAPTSAPTSAPTPAPTPAPTSAPTPAPTTSGKRDTKSSTPNVAVRMTVAGTKCPDIILSTNKQVALERALQRSVEVAQGKITLIACDSLQIVRSSRRRLQADSADLEFEIVTDDKASPASIDALIERVNKINTDTEKAEFARFVEEEAAQLGVTDFKVTVRSVSGQKLEDNDDSKCDGRCIGGVIGGLLALLLLMGLGYRFYSQKGGGADASDSKKYDDTDTAYDGDGAVGYDNTERKLEAVTVDGEETADNGYGYNV